MSPMSPNKEAHPVTTDPTDSFRKLIEKMADGVVVIDRTGVIRYVNPAAETLLGRPSAELVSVLFGTPIVPSERMEVDLCPARPGLPGTADRGKHEDRRSGLPGIVRAAEMRVVEIEWEETGGPVPAYLATLRDITERRRAGDALRFLAQASTLLADSLDYHTTLKSVVQLAVLHLADWCLIDLVENDQSIRRLVASADRRAALPSRPDGSEEPPYTLTSVLEGRFRLDAGSQGGGGGGQSPPTPPCGLAEVLRSGTLRVHGEVNETLLAGLALDAAQLQALRRLAIKSVLIVPLVARGRSIGAITFLSLSSAYRYDKADCDLAADLAHRAALAVDNARMYDEAQTALRKRDEFLAMLAHELRNPLAPILHATQLMKLGGALESRLEWARATIERQGQHISRLLDDLLDLSRITHGKIELRKRTIDVGSVVTDAVQTSRGLVEARQHQLVIDLDAGPLLVEADPTRLNQVLGNLLNNAAKYTPPGGRIELSVQGTEEEIVLRVRDNGIGIPPAMLARVFEPFTQVNPSLDRSTGGLGIGLTLVQNLVEMQGGRVIAQSQGENQGSEFTVSLPRSPRTENADWGLEQEAQFQAHSPARLGPSGGAQAARRVLLVEDNTDARELLVELLRLWGHTVKAAPDGMTGLTMLRRSLPDVALIDIGLPNLDGYRLAQQVRTYPGGERIVLIALTGYGQVEARKKSLAAGFDAHLVKPVDLNQLAQLLTQGTGTRPLQSEG